MPKVQWIADVTYRTKKGPVDVRHHMEELLELHELIERGPSFLCIEDISIRYVSPIGTPGMTVEDEKKNLKSPKI